MPRILEKTERRLGEKLFLKGERCFGPKCALSRRAYPPGAHGKKKSGRKRSASGFSQLLTEKQKIRFLYGLDDKDIERYATGAALKRGIFSQTFLHLLESRLDNAVFRLGIAESRSAGRQLVVHGHVRVNGRGVNVPSYRVRKGDLIAPKERATRMPFWIAFLERSKKYQPPAWLRWNAEAGVGEVIADPEVLQPDVSADPVKIKEFYSR